MRRYGWQIGGVGIAVALVAALALLAHASSGHASVPHERTVVTPRATPTVDVRVAEVEAAAKRYVEALDTAMRTGSPDELDSLSVPGSQAEGNAGASAHVVHNEGKAFVVTDVTYHHVNVETLTTAATATLDYAITGYDASWPTLHATGSSQTIAQHVVFDFSLVNSSWLVDTVR